MTFQGNAAPQGGGGAWFQAWSGTLHDEASRGAGLVQCVDCAGDAAAYNNSAKYGNFEATSPFAVQLVTTASTVSPNEHLRVLAQLVDRDGSQVSGWVCTDWRLCCWCCLLSSV